MSDRIFTLLIENATQDGECLLWKGSMVNGAYPCFRHEDKTLLVRREVWKAMGRPLSSRTAIVVKCGEQACVSPDHLKAAKRGPKPGSRRKPSTIANVTAAMRERSRLSAADVEYIRNRTEPRAALVARFSVSASTVRDIQSGNTWSSVTVAHPFAGLGARA